MWQIVEKGEMRNVEGGAEQQTMARGSNLVQDQ